MILRRRCYFRLKRSLLLLGFMSTVAFLVTAMFLSLNHDFVSFARISRHPGSSSSGGIGRHKGARSQFFPDNYFQKMEMEEEIRKEAEMSTYSALNDKKMERSDIERRNRNLVDLYQRKFVVQRQKIVERYLSYDVHLFYYGWYGNPKFDNGSWIHWNHQYIPPWDKTDKKKYPNGTHVPPDDIGSNFYPQLGPYSSNDPDVLTQHMQMIKKSGTGVIVYSWYPPGMADENGRPSDTLVPVLLDKAYEFGLKVALHVEPYINRTASNFKENLRYVKEKYGHHPAYYRRKRTRASMRSLPVFYLYDSYNLPAEEWARLFSAKGDLSVRGTELDAIFLGLLVEFRHRGNIKHAKFDGFYTYFATNGFTYGSSWKNWKSLSSYATKNSLLFVPSLGPGYIDTRIRPWNGVNTRDRHRGNYYETAWKIAISSDVSVISITSFNEWHEGTQIEPAVSKKTGNYTYRDYSPEEPDFYLRKTAWGVHLFCEKRQIDCRDISDHNVSSTSF